MLPLSKGVSGPGMPFTINDGGEDYTGRALLSLEFFLIEAFQVIMEQLAMCLFHSNEGRNSSLFDFVYRELLNELVT